MLSLWIGKIINFIFYFRQRLVFPPVPGYFFYKLISFSIYLFFGVYYKSIVAGALTGYIMYDTTHYFIHHNKPTISYWKNLKDYHILHHYKNPKLGFGVSNKIWDYVFDTVLPDRKIE